MGGEERKVESGLYKVELTTNEGLVEVIWAYSLKHITTFVTLPILGQVAKVFPNIDIGPKFLMQPIEK